METRSVTVGPRIVRAWFDTVVNPLIDALESEMRVMQDGNFTWRFRPAGFEYIRPIRQHLDPRFLANLEQLCTLYLKSARPSESTMCVSSRSCVAFRDFRLSSSGTSSFGSSSTRPHLPNRWPGWTLLRLPRGCGKSRSVGQFRLLAMFTWS